jgi:histidine triad (HIT) family protein
MSVAPEQDLDAEDTRKHLEFIQGTISRMSQASSSTKSWLLPVVVAAYGYAITRDAPEIALLGVFGVLLFAYLDANYLNQERAFRSLYRAVAKGEHVPKFCMDPNLDADKDSRKPAWVTVPELSVWTSWSIGPFYLGLAVIGLGASLYAC